MAADLLIHATGVCALVLNVLALLRTCERGLRLQSGFAGVLWALNNLLLEAHAAAALSLVSAGRTATSAATLRCGARWRLACFAGFTALVLGVGVATWSGWSSLALTGASLLSTYSMFYLAGLRLRAAMLAVSALWTYHAWTHGSWEQIAANAATAGAAIYSAWRLGRAAPAASCRAIGAAATAACSPAR